MKIFITKGRASERKNVIAIFGKVIFATFSVAWAGFNAFATGIPSGTSSPTCDYGTLESYTGPVGLEASYDPNEITLRWYSMNTQMENVATVSNTCEYDSTLTIPSTPPTRTGYDFDGWTVRPTYDFTTLPTNSSATSRYAKGWKDGAGNCGWFDGSWVTEPCSNSEYTDLAPHEFKIGFSWGTVYGTTKCSSEAGTWAYATTPSDTGGKYCYCQVNGYKPSNSNTIYGRSSDYTKYKWVYVGDQYGSETGCVSSCPKYCTYSIGGDAAMRVGVFVRGDVGIE